MPEQQITNPKEKTLRGVFGGDYSTEQKDDCVLKIASFKDLVPGQEYLLLALISITTETPLSMDNLLHIKQAVASENGTLVFRYVQREDVDISYVMVCGASNQNIEDASVIFPPMNAHQEITLVNPIVEYKGKRLTEGVDYLLDGDVFFTNGGTYTVTIHGIHMYTGVLQCTYNVADHILGDFDSDGIVTNTDVEYLLWYTLFPEDYPIDQDADFDIDGVIDNKDVEYLLWYTLFPEEYPLKKTAL